MSIDNIKCLSSNPHFSALLIQSFLTGYERECDLVISFLVLPFLFYSESREKLKRAKNSSRLDTLFGSKQDINEIKLSAKTRLAGFFARYNLLEEQSKHSIIILSSEKKIYFDGLKIKLKNEVIHSKYKGQVKEWLRCAYNLGKILSKYTSRQIIDFLEEK